MLRSVYKFISFYTRRLIVRVTFYALLAIFAVLASVVIGPYLPDSWLSYMGEGALETVLGTLASTMLSVAIFSLTILSSTFRATESSATPRAVLILREDQTTHRVLSAFIGAFLFALTGIILLATPLMSQSSRFVLFVVSVIVALQVVVAIIRWIHHIEQLGSMENLLDCLQLKSFPVMEDYAKSSSFGAQVLDAPVEARGAEVVDLKAARCGYVRMIAFDALQEEAEALSARVFLHVRPGDYVAEGDPLLRLDCGQELSETRIALLRNMIVLGSTRDFEQDPEFCLIVMTEVGNRALSPGINDPQTAVDVTHRLGALLARASRPSGADDPLRYDRIWMEPLAPERLLASSLAVIARAGGDTPEVAEALRAAFRRVAASDLADWQKAAKRSAARGSMEI